jgi:endonuclease/exonuclease/phosphatase family metal-dependent hydrolase
MLSLSLGNEKHMPLYDSSVWVDRIDKIIAKLTKQINQGVDVFTLHEVDSYMQGRLDKFFSNKRFNTFHQNHGYYKNGYMGSYVAVRNTIKIYDVSYTRLSDLINYHNISKHTTFSSWVKWLSNKYYGEPEKTATEIIQRKCNRLVSVTVIVCGKKVSVVTVHNPCCYTRPDVMTELSSLIVKHCNIYEKRINPDSLVLTGDFNIEPDSEAYNILCDYKPSVYHTYFDSEPDHTIASAFGDNEPFIGTLDYAFTDAEVTKVMKLDDRTKDTHLYPNKSVPESDHLPIKFTISV